MSGSLPLHLSAAGVSVVVDVAAGTPRILYWGAAVAFDDADLAELADTAHRVEVGEGVSAPVAPTVIPLPADGWVGTPGIEGHRDGTAFSPELTLTGVEVARTDDAQTIEAALADPAVGIEVTVRLALLASGILRADAELANVGEDTYTLDALRVLIPVPAEADELLDFVGRHIRERSPQRKPFDVGTHLREGRRGRTGSDATPVLVAGSAGFGFRQGEAWGVHVAWSGHHRALAEHGYTGTRVLGGGELLLPGEVRLEPGEAYRAPAVYAAYGDGLDALAGRFHAHLRARPQHPRSPRPVVINTWEAVYFDHDLDALTALAEKASSVGVERFVLDDGWFVGRTDDTRALGDWQVDPERWPEGLAPLFDRVRGLGMEVGLWFEPEMINEDSELFRAHPDWILGPAGRIPRTGRHQQVLNLAHPDAYAHLLETMSELIARYGIDYIKWDHNRDLLEPGDVRTGRAAVHAQTLAAYALIDELKRRHPGLEIESCASGGGRIDLGILERTDRVWASDCIDALERQQIERWTAQLIPPELIGSHVGSPTAHTTGRTHTLGFRAATALFGHFGIEWDLRRASDGELEELRGWIELYRRERALLHSGSLVRLDVPDPAYAAHGVVSVDGERALFTFVATDTGVSAFPGRLRLAGLDPRRRYRVEPIDLSRGGLISSPTGQPAWIDGEAVATGDALQRAGLAMPRLHPEQAFVFRLTAV
ncbi:alpha-galactosidase [Microbacterium sp. G2-8]|uniref:alpha-galactosidase n=1 Tax=Microbacterium sp. G2-8 TaxID=2842454 RepID=UPI001C89285B|nr:alpha-galactosidase [Microbacterium sp. G2-8]